MRLLAIVTIFAIAASASAHDFWIEPSSWSPEPGQLVSILFRSGDAFRGEVVPRNAARTEHFAVRDTDGEKPVSGIDGRDPAGMFRAGDQQCAMVIYQGKPREVELSASRFSRYVREEGLEPQLRERVRGTVTDRYSRSAVTLLRRGTCEVMDPSPAIALQIVPDRDPSSSDEITFTLLFDSKPAQGVTLIAYSRNAASEEQRGVTDGDGRVTFRLRQRGPWLVKAVKIVREEERTFRSHWASLTFSR